MFIVCWLTLSLSVSNEIFLAVIWIFVAHLFWLAPSALVTARHSQWSGVVQDKKYTGQGFVDIDKSEPNFHYVKFLSTV